MTGLQILIVGCGVFGGVLAFGPYLLIRAVSGPIHDPEHIAACRYPGGKQLERQLPSDGAQKARVGSDQIIIHHGSASK